MTYSPTMIANNILSRTFAEKNYITPMKLQKILYFVASEYQKMTGKPLLEEPFSTWAYGPVLYSVYNEFRSFSRKDIKRYARDAEGNTLVISEDEDIRLKMAIDLVWNKTKNKTAVQLSEITHIEDSAWDKAYQQDFPTLQPEDILSDKTYREALSF
ncbi:Panacea domain-containing protein [Corynebacterium sp. sy039]|uniref:Panacea domain-containing protein n=1 Tax=Corynebacterium sp. sy039 TaxID=2599641 RepID=UPI0011B61411|nr:type II toxin-antitoxin system antitoxin SocA domain-containing protein [Corynebacterium sp. sy039]QDZ41964.1 DUF4065 domain-containing protein [Corynebacterium sp. sy039]